MKLKNIILISLLLMIILTVSSVCATDDFNQTDNVNDDIVTSDEPIKEDVNLTIYDKPETIIKGVSDNAIYLEISKSGEGPDGRIDKMLDGNICMDIDGKNIYNSPAVSIENEISYSVIENALGNKFGLHNITVGLFNDSNYNDVSQSWQLNYGFHDLNIPSTYNMGFLEATFSPDAAGTVDLYIDGKKIATEKISYGNVYFDLDNIAYTTHKYKLVFTSTKNTNVYKSFKKEGTFKYEYYFDVTALNDVLNYGEDGELEIMLPYGATKKVQVTYNGITKSYASIEDDFTYVQLKDLKLGKNKITITYPGDKKYSKRSIEIIVTVNEIMNVTKDVGYKSGNGIYLKMPEDAKGNLSVIVDDVETTHSIKNGIAHVDLSGYEMGTHTLKVNYTGDDYSIKGYDGTFDVVANFIYMNKVYYKDGVNVSVALPSDANGTMIVSYDYRYRIAQVINGSASVFFEDIPAYEEMEFKFEYLDGNYNDYKKYDTISVREDQPDDLKIYIPKKVIMRGGEYFIGVSPGTYGEGLLNVSVDGKYYGTYEFYENNVYISLYDLVKKMKLGNHTIQFDYSGDGYYKDKTVTKTFEYDYYFLEEDDLTIGENDLLDLNLASDATGTAKLYVDGKEVKGYKNYDEECKELSIVFDMASISCGEHAAKIVFSGDKKYPNFTKNFKFNVTYVAFLDVSDELYQGENETLHFGFSADIEKVNLTIDNVTYVKPVDDRELNFEMKNLTFGKHNISIDCISSKYPMKTFNWTINVTSQIKVPEQFNIIDGENVTLTLPSDASGNLEVLIYDKGILLENITQKVENGTANVPINCSKLGYYEIFARYIGDDYPIDKVNSKFKVMPRITYPEKIYVQQDANVTIELPSDLTGKLIVAIGNERLDVNYINGSAVVKLPRLNYMDDVYYLRVSYTNDPVYGDYFDDTYNYIDILRYTPNIAVTLPKEIIANNVITLTFTLPSDAKGHVFTDDDYYGTVKNGKGSVKAYIPKAGKNTITYYYSGDKKYDEFEGKINVTALPAPKLTMNAATVYYTSTATFKVNVVDSYGKIVSGKYVTFYVNGKKIKSVKTDKKGYASIKLKKTPKVYNVKATYKGGVVTKKLTVKHLVTLKTASVKKSARKLVLKVTLKKGKKALKWKKVTIKFNGKKYKVYTNSKGVAKVTIKKSVLKKLKVGKKVTYQAIYLKDTVKKTAKVVK